MLVHSNQDQQISTIDWAMTIFSTFILFDYVGFIETYFHSLILILGVIYWSIRIGELVTGVFLSDWIRNKYKKIKILFNKNMKKKNE